MSDAIPEAGTGFKPAVEQRITDLETVRVIAEPLRFRLIQTMSARFDEPWTVKEIARALGEPTTKLYYHVGLLEERGIVVVVGSRLVSGIVEKRYQLAAERFAVDRSLLSPEDPSAGETFHSILGTVFEAARADIDTAVRQGVARLHGGDEAADDGPEEVLLSHSVDRLSRADAAEFRARLRALAEEFGQRSPGASPPAAPDGGPYGLVLAFYPMVDVPKPRSARAKRRPKSSGGEPR
jgi:hypothetical protein